MSLFEQQKVQPFGLVLNCKKGTSFTDLDVTELETLALKHRVLVLRGLDPWSRKEDMVDAVRAIGPLQSWGFGGVHDLKVDPDAENYLYTKNAVPLHWDGAFANETPRWLIFQCIEADDDKGGETLFADTQKALAAIAPGQQKEWSKTITLSTQKKAYYGGTVKREMVIKHPATSESILRFAEPVDDLNPVSVVIGNNSSDGHKIIEEISAHLRKPEFMLEHRWQKGDVVIADNDTLLHGRSAFAANSKGTRRIWRANILKRERPWWQPFSDSYKIRRPEFLKAEIPIVLIPALLTTPDFASLKSVSFFALLLLFALLLQIGDLVNCYADRQSDRVFKTHLSEAVRRLGKKNIMLQVGVMSAALMAIALLCWLMLGRPFWIPLGALIGAAMAALYSAGPKPMKRSGIWQVGWYVILLFVGPMVLVSGTFLEWPNANIILVAISFGLMQASVLLVNNAEDLREDIEAKVNTATVAIGKERVFDVALVAFSLGLVGLLSLLIKASPHSALAALILCACALATLFWIFVLRKHSKIKSDEAFNRYIKKQGKWVPRFLTANAWAALLLALASRVGSLF